MTLAEFKQQSDAYKELRDSVPGNDAQQMAISGQHASLWSILFGNVEPLWSWREIAEATKKHMHRYAIHIIKKQPFFI